MVVNWLSICTFVCQGCQLVVNCSCKVSMVVNCLSIRTVVCQGCQLIVNSCHTCCVDLWEWLTASRVLCQSAHIVSWLSLELDCAFDGANIAAIRHGPLWVLILSENWSAWREHAPYWDMQNPSVKGALGSVALHCVWSAGVKAQVLKACSNCLSTMVALRVMTESHFVDNRWAAHWGSASCVPLVVKHTPGWSCQ